MVCEVKVNALKLLTEKETIDDTRKIIDEKLFNAYNKALTDLAVKKYGLDTDGQLLFDISNKKLVDERTSTYRRDSIISVSRAEPNEILFNKLQQLKIIYDNAQAIANNSINLKTDENQDSSLYGLDMKNNLVFSNETLNSINSFIDAIGVGYRLTSFESGDILAAANFIDNTIDVIEDSERRPSAWNKMPEEAAHWWYKLLKEDAPLKKQLWNAVETLKKSNELYNTAYKNLENINSPEDLTEEAIGQVIAEAIKKIETGKATPAQKSLWTKIVDYIKNIISKFQKAKTENNENPFDIAAAKILAGDTSELLTLEEYNAIYNQASLQKVEANIDDIIQSELGEVVETEIEPSYFDYLINKKFKKKSRYLKKTIEKITTIDRPPIQKITDPKLTLTTTQLTLASKTRFLEKYKKPIALNSNINVDGAKKEEMQEINEVRELIKKENPTLKFIDPVEFMETVEEYLKAKYEMSTRFLTRSIETTYRGSFISKNENLEHARIAQHFRNEYTRGGHFYNNPFAWITLTPFANKKKLLIHETQSDFIESVAEIAKQDIDNKNEQIIHHLIKQDKYFDALSDSLKNNVTYDQSVYQSFKHKLAESEDFMNQNKSALTEKFDAASQQEPIDKGYQILWALKYTARNNFNLWEKD